MSIAEIAWTLVAAVLAGVAVYVITKELALGLSTAAIVISVANIASDY